jgi:predicted nucleotidyltransferase
MELMMLDLKDIRRQITDGLNTSPRPLKVILFGSYARGMPHDESDIDLVVILDREGKSDSYRSLIKNRMEISRRLRDLKKRYPMDILVYTKDEWEELRASESSFIRKIEKHGIAIL